jgi:hypothetical protein
MSRRPLANLNRRPPRREPKRRFFLFCEGTKTEPNYFRAVGRSFPDALIEIVIAQEAGVPRTLADAAVAKAKDLGRKSRRRNGDSFEEGDQVWVVFDRDEHPHFDDAIKMCKSRDVGVARSNPCFELWLILHQEVFDRPDDRDGVQAHFSTLFPADDRRGRKGLDWADLVTRVESAENRAEAQLDRREAEGNVFGRPSTTVGVLTKAIRDAAEKSRRD